ncbi:YcjF family protein [Lutimaribacter sp. EGI FJ00015]|uniref:YcjF family protein n=1 Tax=Lutimaribacter degradans TaxID=2945989 RepID=A0ACC5ZTD9_9RHOB|nr:TIGR01620 family protein [Lutimaribacter sp. EGI FJ00013]MCM2561445.1 YcjF family protein [Lutimaribacter sp. EGI FJ00013]MCO0612845.1 YcjF family protein [Lutimaribacter sp. EGI FJ00015]MCO0635503.1 YcjF family protein [Lutimaribacter sp. EGI FJ00014]
MTNGPVLIDLEDDDSAPGPDAAPPVPDPDLPPPQGRAMKTVATLGARRPSWLARWFWGLLLAVLGAVLSVAAWDFATGLIARMPLLGYAVTVLIGALVLVALLAGLREMAAFARLARMDKLQGRAEAALSEASLPKARAVVAELERLYARRPELDWNRARFTDRRDEQFDANALFALTEAEMLAPLDAAARVQVEAAARQVATVTAIVPLALADVAVALSANLRMIRRIAEIYGGRSGVLGSWRLTRAVMTHLVATGAVAVGDDLISSVAGGNVLSKLSRRFGEGIVNGALTARVGIAAMEVCRPLPFGRAARPSVSGTVKRALAGLFGG